MTFNLDAIFGTEAVAVIPLSQPVVIEAPADSSPSDTVCIAADAGVHDAADLWPVVEGTEHFSIWVDDDLGSWPEFIPGHHYDIRQPSRPRGLCSPSRIAGDEKGGATAPPQTQKEGARQD